jgi:iron complex outermembrane receptor protein
MNRSHVAREWIYAAILFAMAMASQPARAQTEKTAAAEEVSVLIVTPQKREQYLQDVPISVIPVSEVLLHDSGVKNIKDLTILTPGVIVTSTTNETATTARIRGIGTQGDNPGLESSVGVVVDGIYRPRNGVSFGDLGDLQQIEIIKGPQGTLFGKNTSAGVINITTKTPEFKFGAGAEVGAGNFSTKQYSGFITGPLVGSMLAGRLYASRDERNGYNSVNVGEGPRTFSEDSDHEQTVVRGQLVFRPSAALYTRLIGDYSKQNETCCAALQINRVPSQALLDALATDSGVANPPNPFARVAYSNRDSSQQIKDRGVSAEIGWDIPRLQGATLTSISAYRDWETVNGLDPDYSTADIAFRSSNGGFGNEFKTLTQELRLAGTAGRLTWLGGVFYANEKLDSKANLTFGSDLEPYYSLLASNGTSATLISTLTGRQPGQAYPLNSQAQDQFNQTSDSYAFFTNDSFAFSDELEGTIGLRYTKEDKSLDSTYANGGASSSSCQILRARRAQLSQLFANTPNPASALSSFYNLGCNSAAEPAFNSFSGSQSINEDNVSGTAKLAYRFSPGLLSYVSYARGYKASGFNLDREIIQGALGAADPNSQADPDTSFPAETVNSYELGLKTSWMNDKLLFNIAAFQQRFKNFQLTVFTGNAFQAAAVPSVTSRGADMDLYLFALDRALTLQAGVTYADTKYGNFTPIGAVPTGLPGNQLSFAPKFSGSLAASYDYPLSSTLTGRASVASKFNSSYNTGADLNPAKRQGAYNLVNARLGIGSSNERWAVEVWGENLTDEKYYQVIIDTLFQPGGLNGYLGDPRTYGVTVRANF